MDKPENTSESFLPEVDFRFSCTGCGKCCSGSPGYVFLSEKDIEGICDFLHMEPEVFIQKHCRVVNIGTGSVLSLKENDDYSCVFMNGTACSVYEARPLQCRTYPFWEEIVTSRQAWHDESKFCPGIGIGPSIHESLIIDMLIEMRNNKSHAAHASFRSEGQ